MWPHSSWLLGFCRYRVATAPLHVAVIVKGQDNVLRDHSLHTVQGSEGSVNHLDYGSEGHTCIFMLRQSMSLNPDVSLSKTASSHC